MSSEKEPKSLSVNYENEYKSPLDQIDPSRSEKFNKIETYKGKVFDIISEIDIGIDCIQTQQLSDERALSLFYRTYELIKMSLNEKVEVDKAKRGCTNEAIAAVRLSVRLAIACDTHDPLARDIFNEYVDLIEHPKLKPILNKGIEETPDREIMPEHPAKQDAALAEEILNKTDGKDFVMVALGHRGIKRAIDIYLDTNPKNSRFWPVRYSLNYYDNLPNVSFQEMDKITKWLKEGRELIIIGPAGRIDTKVIKLFEAAIPSPRQGEKKKEIISIELPLATGAKEGEENETGNGFLKRAKILKGLKPVTT